MSTSDPLRSTEFALSKAEIRRVLGAVDGELRPKPQTELDIPFYGRAPLTGDVCQCLSFNVLNRAQNEKNPSRADDLRQFEFA